MPKDHLTQELLGVPKRRGRPPTTAQDKKSLKAAHAARQAAYRARKAAEGRVELPPVFVSVEVRDALVAYVDRQNADVAAEPISMGDAVDRILRAHLLRKR